jgi:hypothetical protein
MDEVALREFCAAAPDLLTKQQLQFLSELALLVLREFLVSE